MLCEIRKVLSDILEKSTDGDAPWWMDRFLDIDSIKHAIELIDKSEEKREECEQALIDTIKYESHSVYFWDPSDIHLFDGGPREWEKFVASYHEEYLNGKSKDIPFKVMLADKFDMRILSDSVVDVIFGKKQDEQ